jgi:hypothetical protein
MTLRTGASATCCGSSSPVTRVPEYRSGLRYPVRRERVALKFELPLARRTAHLRSIIPCIACAAATCRAFPYIIPLSSRYPAPRPLLLKDIGAMRMDDPMRLLVVERRHADYWILEQLLDFSWLPLSRARSRQTSSQISYFEPTTSR